MIKVINYTKQPLSLMGEVASTCWNSTPSARIGRECIESGHMRVAEYADVTIEISGYSARMIREVYTHILGVSRLQESTRYINYDNFNYYTPPTIEKNPHAKSIYDATIETTRVAYQALVDEYDIPKQDVANLLPLGMFSKMVLKINVRALIHMAEERLCTRAYIEYRDFMKELLKIISELDSEWKEIVENYCKVKCDKIGYCTEKHTCGRKPHKDKID